ncbi:MAG: hypothetical protein CM15mP74_05840 [Halieaceae bacterium]|nr:MAG: hypothetical protein CM15mP74_05840 [Halieaceae bacterium]
MLRGERALICDFVNLLCEASLDGVICVTDSICRVVLMRAALNRVVCNALILITFVLATQASRRASSLVSRASRCILYTGISNLRGWAVAESGIGAIEIDIDGAYAFNVPMGGSRGDVANAYPDFPNSDASGFSMAFNYKNLSAGNHVVTVRAISNDGNVATRSATITVSRFVSTYIQNADQVDTGTVTDVVTSGQSIQLNDLC